MFALFDVTCVAFLISLLLTPLVRNLSIRLNLLDHPDGDRKEHLISIPRVGGVAVAIAYALALAFVFFAPYRNITLDISDGIAAARALSPAALIILCVGLIDDILSLKPWQKLIGEVVAAALAYYAGFGIHVMQGQPLEPWLSLPLTVLWLVGCANALNLIDGMDGLAAGVGVFATLTSFVAGLIHDNIALAFVTAPLVGALMGFLRYNFNPASIFLGDCGSLFIGFLLGCFGTMWGQKSATAVGMTAPLIALAMPLLDTGLAIARRFLRGQPIFSADRGHIHHRLLDRGLTPRRAVLVLYGFCGLAAVLSLLQEVAMNQYRGIVIVLFCCSAWVGVQHLGYAEFGITSRIVLRGAFRRTVAAQMTLQQFERTLEKTETMRAAWEVILIGVKDFHAAGVRLELAEEVLESVGAVDAVRDWQVQVPLPEGQRFTVWFDPAKDIQPVVQASFPRIVGDFIAVRFLGAPDPALNAAALPTAPVAVRDAAAGT